MEYKMYKSTGWSLTIGSFLAIITMILHPAGGNISDIINQKMPLQISHAIAISCLPFMLFGFYGLTKRHHEKLHLSYLALSMVAFGLFSALLAALLNGLVLPDFLDKYSNSIHLNKDTLSALMSYGFSINKALDYVFIIALCSSITLYSFLMLKTQKSPKTLGYLGILIFSFSIFGLVFNFAFTSLVGFRIFVFSIAGWILYSGISLIQSNKE